MTSMPSDSAGGSGAISILYVVRRFSYSVPSAIVLAAICHLLSAICYLLFGLKGRLARDRKAFLRLIPGECR